MRKRAHIFFFLLVMGFSGSAFGWYTTNFNFGTSDEEQSRKQGLVRSDGYQGEAGGSRQGGLAPAVTSTQGRDMVVIETSHGDITIELDNAKAPVSVKNFLNYIDSGYYNGTIFHRVIKNFMIQGGGLTAELQPKPPGNAPIKNEASNGLKNKRGTIAAARTGIVDSATSQFFINLVDNSFLDHRNESSSGFGYAVFGKVVGGMEVVDKIGASATGMRNRFSDVPVETITIRRISRIE